MEKIDLIELYNTVSALLRKHHNGYMAPDIFNTNLKLVERELFNHFIRYYELKHIVVEHMEPFKRYEVIQTNHDGVMEFPSDHAYRIALEGFYLKNPDAADAIAYPCPYLQETQISTVLSSTVIAPSLEKKIFYHTFRNGAIAVFPADLFYIGYSYFRNPKYGAISASFTTVNGEDVETITVAVPSEWRTITFKFFVVLLLNKFGISLKEDPQYYAAVQQIEQILGL
ncbi:MAG TPA: hypothetical protein PLJ00_05860 [Chitinophagales bacterium]|nr:hypothetical protein [Chitinophagales bacterium]